MDVWFNVRFHAQRIVVQSLKGVFGLLERLKFPRKRFTAQVVTGCWIQARVHIKHDPFQSVAHRRRPFGLPYWLVDDLNIARPGVYVKWHTAIIDHMLVIPRFLLTWPANHFMFATMPTQAPEAEQPSGRFCFWGP